MSKTQFESLQKDISETRDRLECLEECISSIDINVKATREIIEIFNDTKGFITTVRIISKVTIWSGATIASMTALYHAIKHFGQS